MNHDPEIFADDNLLEYLRRKQLNHSVDADGFIRVLKTGYKEISVFDEDDDEPDKIVVPEHFKQVKLEKLVSCFNINASEVTFFSATALEESHHLELGSAVAIHLPKLKTFGDLGALSARELDISAMESWSDGVLEINRGLENKESHQVIFPPAVDGCNVHCLFFVNKQKFLMREADLTPEAAKFNRAKGVFVSLERVQGLMDEERNWDGRLFSDIYEKFYQCCREKITPDPGYSEVQGRLFNLGL